MFNSGGCMSVSRHSGTDTTGCLLQWGSTHQPAPPPQPNLSQRSPLPGPSSDPGTPEGCLFLSPKVQDSGPGPAPGPGLCCAAGNCPAGSMLQSPGPRSRAPSTLQRPQSTLLSPNHLVLSSRRQDRSVFLSPHVSPVSCLTLRLPYPSVSEP